MKILCDTLVTDRHSHRGVKATKATLAIGYKHGPKDASEKSSRELTLVHFTPQCKTGKRYKVAHIERIHTGFVMDGKATIVFREPCESIMIRCDPLQLKTFLHGLRQLGGQNSAAPNFSQNVNFMAAIPQKAKPVEKMTVLKRSDYPLKGFPQTLKTLAICSIELQKVSFEICTLRNLTTLNLSNNKLTKLPPELGRLALTDLRIDHNLLGETNDWRWLAGNKHVCHSLINLDMSGNQLTYFPPQLVRMEQLVLLKLNNNELRRVPYGLRRMRSLRFLHLATNQLTSLPSVFHHQRLDMLDIWGNDFLVPEEPQPRAKLAAAPPSSRHVLPLWLLAARAVCKNKLRYSYETLPWEIVDLMLEAPLCACGNLCYDGITLKRAAIPRLTNVKEMVFSRDQLIYADVVLCNLDCVKGRSICF